MSACPADDEAWLDDRIVTESQKIGELYGALAEQLDIKCINCGKWELPLLYDGVHLSEEGHAEFAEKLISEPEALPESKKMHRLKDY